MRLVQALIIDFKGSRSGISEKTNKSWSVHEFSAHETDLDGSRIPIIFSTMNDSIRDFLITLKGRETHIPFTKSSSFAGKEVYQVDESILRMSVDKKA